MPTATKAAISNNLDLLRAIAVLCVFVSHLLGAAGYLVIRSLGHFGVILFFVHTSFVLMGSLERLDRNGVSDVRYMVAFWARRIFRIYPLSILFVVLAATFHTPSMPGVVYEWIGAKGFVANLGLFENLTYARDILGPLWSLPLEVQMYVMLPFAYFIIRRNVGYRSAGLWVFSIALALTVPRISGRLNVFEYAPCFTSGIVAFDLLRKRARYAQRLSWWLWPIGIMSAIFLFTPLDNLNLLEKIYRAWFLSLGIGLLYVFVAEAPCNSIQRVLHWIAEHSYGIYLSHIVVIWFVFYPMAATPIWVRAAVLAISAVAIPGLLYRYVEEPLMYVGHRLSGLLVSPRLHRGKA
jgi:peptidoglycan/LPS O-acetylase OafA/YrhL